MSEDVWEGKRLGVIGAGNMAEAIVRGATAAGVIAPGRIAAFDPLPERRELFAALGCQAAATACAAAACEAVLLSVKPQSLRRAAEEIRSGLRPGTLAISIVAGVPTRILAEILAPGVKIIRVMPNTPLLVGQGMSCLSQGPGAGEVEMRLALALFAAAGAALELPEGQLDAVTALSGGGPAYLFRFAEALMAGGEGIGLSAETARLLTVNTLRGAAEMLFRGGEAADLRARVTSKGGTTAEALRVFEAGRLTVLTAEALKAAKERSAELGREA
ncbi:MAG: pyrroline-5-carboxylate reductase [Planctomycetota bacterium]|jgi:pyrroline-5-carboxylate reductase|nr:pyrroline-5-carboxylate reductase [Planctomycetota bacterium]